MDCGHDDGAQQRLYDLGETLQPSVGGSGRDSGHEAQRDKSNYAGGPLG